MNGSKLISSSSQIADFYANKKTLLQKALHQFVENVKFFPQIGVELEFYLLDQNSQIIDNKGLIADYISELTRLFLADSAIYKIEKEQGASQIEIKISPHLDLILLAKKISQVKEVAQNLAQKNNFIACFEAQPFLEDCGSALQFNVSLHDAKGKNLFSQQDQLFFSTIAGMLDSIDLAMIFYAPQEKDYLRFDKEINRRLHKNGKFSAPVNISFGEDNRTVAIRVPRALKEDHRIEFRVAAANADPFLAMTSLLIAMPYAINREDIPQVSQKIFGNAFDEQYLLKDFAKNLQIAEENFWQEENFLRKKLESFN